MEEDIEPLSIGDRMSSLDLDVEDSVAIADLCAADCGVLQNFYSISRIVLQYLTSAERNAMAEPDERCVHNLVDHMGDATPCYYYFLYAEPAFLVFLRNATDNAGLWYDVVASQLLNISVSYDGKFSYSEPENGPLTFALKPCIHRMLQYFAHRRDQNSKLRGPSTLVVFMDILTFNVHMRDGLTKLYYLLRFYFAGMNAYCTDGCVHAVERAQELVSCHHAPVESSVVLREAVMNISCKKKSTELLLFMFMMFVPENLHRCEFDGWRLQLVEHFRKRSTGSTVYSHMKIRDQMETDEMLTFLEKYDEQKIFSIYGKRSSKEKCHFEYSVATTPAALKRSVALCIAMTKKFNSRWTRQRYEPERKAKRATRDDFLDGGVSLGSWNKRCRLVYADPEREELIVSVQVVKNIVQKSFGSCDKRNKKMETLLRELVECMLGE